MGSPKPPKGNFVKHLLILLISILLLSSPLFGQETGVLFLQLENGDVKYYENRIEDRDGKYVGEINNGKPNGQGIESYSDGEEYVGEWKNGKKQGLGIYNWNNGQKYVGEWKNGEKDGLGILSFPDGRKIIGEYRKGKSWNITEYNKNGNITGKYVNGLKVEKRRKVVLFEREVDGVLGWYENGDEREDTKFVGEIKNGKQNGEGTQTYPDGRKYVGEWKNGEYHGQGTFTSPDGNKYDGEWKDGTYHGHGTYTFGKVKWEGDKYIGEYKNGKKDGQGTYTFSDGRKYLGEFKHGKKHGQGTFTTPDGDKYVGEFKDGKQDGQGTLTSRFEKEYVGEFKEGTFWNITEYDKNGNILGKWVNGKLKVK